MLQLSAVKKEYEDRTILSVPELILSGGIYWLTGANGSGKTTLLQIIAGLIPAAGSISVNGIDLHLNPSGYRSQVSFAEPEPLYPPFLTGRELILFYARIRKAALTQTDQLIEQLGFGQFLSSPIGTYSSGMVKRLSLLLAFIGPAKWILLDEPLATLDAEASMVLPALIMEYHRMYGTNFIFSSHTSFTDENIVISQKLFIQDQTIRFTA